MDLELDMEMPDEEFYEPITTPDRYATIFELF